MKKNILYFIAVFSVPACAGNEVEKLISSSERFEGVESDILKKASESALWSQDKSALAFCFETAPSQCFILKGEKIIDVSAVENGNLGKLGISLRSIYERCITYPTKWVPRGDGFTQIEFTTQVWKDGQRYTAKEPLVINKEGLPLYR